MCVEGGRTGRTGVGGHGFGFGGLSKDEFLVLAFTLVFGLVVFAVGILRFLLGGRSCGIGPAHDPPTALFLGGGTLGDRRGHRLRLWAGRAPCMHASSCQYLVTREEANSEEAHIQYSAPRS